MQQLTLDVASKVFKTKNLNQFKKLIGNRNLSQGQILRLEKSILENNLLAINPILVNKDMSVIDGQTRLEVARRNNLEITYIIADNIGINEAMQLNKVVATWKPLDHLNTKVMNKDPEYVKFNNFMNKYPKLNIQKNLHAWLNSCNNLPTALGGKIDQLSFNADLAEKMAKVALVILNLDSDIKYLNKYCVIALRTLCVNPDFSTEVFEKKLTSFKSMLKFCGRASDQTENFLFIYNRKNRNPLNIKGYKQH